MVSDLDRTLQVITEFDVNGNLPEYKSTTVFDDYEDADDYLAKIKENQLSVKVEHDTVKIRSRFSPSIHSSFRLGVNKVAPCSYQSMKL